ncbi:MAG: proprotein convertase P-domain-containing protein [Raineya sp.]|jgi:subtilisin-like proprotein convertase family protein|nr:proprotein convertase P-domain-containing protein [Raineya sp.]
MQKKLLQTFFYLSILFFSQNLFAQNIQNYTATAASNESLEDMSSGTTTLIGGNQGLIASSVTAIGFEVFFMGQRFTDFSVNAGGVLRFGTSIINTDANTMAIVGHHRVCTFANSTPGTSNELLWRTHSSGKVHYKVVGTAPNRRLVVEWQNMKIDGTSTTANATWQAHIYETAPNNTNGGVIRIIYGQMNVGTFSSAISCSGGIAPRVGLGAGDGTNQYVAMDADQHPTVTGSAISYTGSNEACYTVSPISLNSASNGSRKFYNFSSVSPNGNITSFSADCVSSTTLQLTWSDNATNELGYAIYRSTDGINYSFRTLVPSGTLNYADTGLSPSTMYYYRIYTYTEGRLSALSGTGSISATTLASGIGSIISIKSGSWNDPSVWTTGTVPTATDDVIIGCLGNHTVTLQSSGATYSNTSTIAIPDNTPSGGVATGNTIPTAATLTGCGTCAFSSVTVPVGTYTGISNIRFSITHTYDSDLDIYLLAPDNTVFVVSTDNGDIDDNYTNTVIQDGSPNINTAGAPFTGTYSLEVGTLASYTGAYNGNWRLYAIDDDTGITGSITNFSVTMAAVSSISGTARNLTINNGSSLVYTNGASLTVNGNLQNSGTLNLTGTSTALDVKGNFTNSNTFTAGTSSTVTFSGSSLQNISNTQIETTTTAFTNTTDYGVGVAVSTPTITDGTVPTATTLASCTNCAVSSVTVPAGTYTALSNINFSINHTFTGDLGIYLVSPNGTVFLISDDNGGSDNNYTNTIISDAGATNITAGTAPFTGTFKPEGVAFSTYSGTYSGTWTLYVLDDASGDSGTLLDFTLTLLQSTGNVLNVHHLTMNGSGGASLNNTNIKVAGTGTFNNGTFATNANRIDFSAGSSVSGGSNASHIVGTARKIGNTAFTFPLGNGTYFAPIGFSPSGTTTITDHFTASYTRVYPNPYDIRQKETSLNHVGNCEYWMLDRTNGSQNATVNLGYNSVRSCGVDAGHESELRVCRWDGSQWRNGGGSVAGTTITSTTTFTNFSPFTLGSITEFNPLPVGMLYFKAKKSNNINASLEWQTEFEINGDKYEVERSLNGKDFIKIGSVDCIGKNAQYQFLDEKIGENAQIAYYRLKALDKDGKFAYTRIESVIFEQRSFDIISIVPNPFKDDFEVAYTLPKAGKVKFTLTDILGRVVDENILDGSSGINTYKATNTSHLASSIYILSLQFEGKIISKKVKK